MTCEWGAGALAALPRAPATWNDGVDGALLCGLLFSLHDDQAHGAMQVLAVLLTGYTPASPRPRQAVCRVSDCSTCCRMPAPSRFCYFT